jgi:hypothetical protein
VHRVGEVDSAGGQRRRRGQRPFVIDVDVLEAEQPGERITNRTFLEP